MPALEKSLRNQLERTVKDARDVAEAGARAAIEQLGVGDAVVATHLDDAQRNLRRRLRIHGRQLGDEQTEKKGAQQTERLIEEVAYEHWHRMLFARFLAENNLLMYPDPDQPVAVSLAECDDLAADEGAANGWELAARFAAQMLPRIFRLDSPVFELQLPPEHQQQLEGFVAALPVDVFTASDSLGWVYQFWQSRRKEQINKSEVKIGARELPAVTQLFTEDYMVDFLLDNTLGAWWAGKVAAGATTKNTKEEAKNGKLAEQIELSDEERQRCEQELRAKVALPGIPWDYLRFIPVDAPGSSGSSFSCRSWPRPHWTPAAGTFDGWPKTAAELRCLDPCMGSGHFIVAMFERLVAMRMAEESLDEADAVAAVIRDNLFGLEIDPRCTQIAAFNLALTVWRRVGYCVLPQMNLACSGLAPNTSKDEWLALAGADEKLQGGMERLYELFEQAPVLGSLISPRADEGDLLAAAFHELQPLLEKALECEGGGHAAHEMAVTARGLAKAAEILAGQFTLIATNVPYLGRRKQDDGLKAYCQRVYSEAKTELATCFIERALKFCESGGSTALLVPQNWLFLTTFESLREKLLRRAVWDFACKMGSRSFQTPMYDFGVVMHSFTARRPDKESRLAGLDVGSLLSPEEKALRLPSCTVSVVSQFGQHKNPDTAIVFEAASSCPLLLEYADSFQGSGLADIIVFRKLFWEIASITNGWVSHQSSPDGDSIYSGMHFAVKWDDGKGELAKSTEATIRGRQAWTRRGIACAWLGKLPVGLYLGTLFDNSAAAIVPKDPAHLAAIWCFTSSPDFVHEVRKINQKAQVANATLVKVPFDLDHWTKIAAEEYPHGLPRPYSDDPTQWVFHGHPCGSVVWNESSKRLDVASSQRTDTSVLQVAVARLLGYRWPAELDAETELADEQRRWVDRCRDLLDHADEDGIVCIPAVRGEPAAADRLLDLLAAAYGDEWNSDLLGRLLADVDYAGKSIESWLRDGFFAQHCALFRQRPFVWHIWDGLRDGFAALVNYHKLDHKTLQTLIYTYLGDWITRQAHDRESGVDGAEERLVAAEQLKKRLELILHGEAPYDIFVRWKPLHKQPLGWAPDLNDGVCMNIRPFVTVPDIKGKGTGVLRVKPKIKWQKDRGKEPLRDKADYPWFWGWDGSTDFPGGPTFTGDRHIDCHYTLAAKTKAREPDHER